MNEGDERVRADVVQPLRSMAAVLAKHGYAFHAGFVSELARLAETGDPAFEEQVATATMWGGSGSVCDVNLRWGTPHPADAPADDVCFRAAVIALARHVDAHSIGSDHVRCRARDIASAFEQWNRQGL